jgi:hypothetical protein
VGWCSKCETFATEDVAARGCEIPTLANLTSASQCHVELPDGTLIPVPIKAWMMEYDNGTIEPDVWWVQSVNNVASTLYARRGFTDVSEDTEDPFPNSKTFLGVKSPQLAMAFVTLSVPWLSVSPPLKVNTAQECVLDLCFLDCDVSVKGGVPETKVLRAQHGIQFQRNFSGDVVPFKCWRPPDVGEADLNWTSNGNDSTSNDNVSPSDPWPLNFYDDHHMAFCLDVWTNAFTYDPFNWGYHVGNLLSSNATTQWTCSYDETINGTSCVDMPDLETKLFPPSSDIIVKLQETLSLSDTFEGIAASLTQLGRDSRPSEVTGQVALPVTYLHIRWEWLILPAVLEVAGIALLLSTMVVAKRAKTPLWKGSVLPFLYHGLEDGMREDVSALESVSSMEREAKARVRLKRAEKGGVGNEVGGRWTLGR